MADISVSDSRSVRRIHFEHNEDHSDDFGTLDVTFANGRTYRYEDVPEAVFARLQVIAEEGESVGSAVNRLVVKGDYSFEELG